MPRRASLFVFLGFAVALVLVTGISAGAHSGGIRAKKADVAVAQDDGKEIDLGAERFEFDRGGAETLWHDDRNFASDIELSRATADGHDVWLGQDLGDVVLLQGIEESEEPTVAMNDAEGQRIRIVRYEIGNVFI